MISEHICQHHKAMKSSCIVCGKAFSNTRSLEQHQEATGHFHFKCIVCDKTFSNARSLEQHQEATGHFQCIVCDKTFSMLRSLEQHQEATGHHEGSVYADGGSSHTSGHGFDFLDSPVDSPGEWVALSDFSGRKSFGYFACGCSKTWHSAHAQPQFRQGCKGCNKKSLPAAMWQNDPGHYDIKSKDGRLEGAHDVERCEACRAGVCKTY